MSQSLRVMVVAGARPNFMKVAPILEALDAAGHQAILVHTGQHYDAAMSDAFFADLGMRRPDHHLEVGAGSHAEQTARVMERFDPVLLAERPDWLVVVGDVNSTLATALVAAKHRSTWGLRIAHVEAGLRSGDWGMPEEVNRVLTDQLADLLLTHSPEAEGHLRAEGIPAERIVFVGNVMMDALFAVRARFPEDAPWLEHGWVREGYGLVTMHRPSNVDDPAQLRRLLDGLAALDRDLPLLWPVHPRARRTLDGLGMALPPSLRLVDPVGYRAMTAWLDGAAVVITDSGGLQEESTGLGVPCVTVRATTERPVTVSEGTNRMVPWPPTATGVRATVAAALAAGRTAGSRNGSPQGWDGRTAERIVAALVAAPRAAACVPLPSAAAAG